MTTQIDAGTPWIERPSPTLLSEANTYPLSTCTAQLWLDVPGFGLGPLDEIGPVDPGETARFLHLHLFLADVPPLVFLACKIDTIGAIGAFVLPGRPYSQPFVSVGATTNAPVGALEFLTLPGVNETLPAFCVRVPLDSGSYAIDPAAAAQGPFVSLYANSAINYGPALGATDAEANPGNPGYVPIVLRDADYTQAMRDAHNVFPGVLPVIGTPCVFHVVGLYSLQVV